MTRPRTFAPSLLLGALFLLALPSTLLAKGPLPAGGTRLAGGEETKPVPAPEDDATASLPERIAAAVALRDAGRVAEAAEAFGKLAAEHPEHAGVAFHHAYCVHATGDTAAAIELHRRAAEFPALRSLSLYNLACALALEGRGGEALDALEAAVGAGFRNATQAHADPDLASVRDEARFAEILDGIGGPPPSAMDFWIGSWECRDARGGKLIGTNVLSKRVDGRVVHERWTPVDPKIGIKGESWSWFDPVSERWKQIWVDARGGVIEFVAEPKEGGLLFQASVPAAAGGAQLRRMFVRPTEEPGHVRQTGSRSNDGGETWIVGYDLLYTPV